MHLGLIPIYVNKFEATERNYQADNYHYTANHVDTDCSSQQFNELTLCNST